MEMKMKINENIETKLVELIELSQDYNP